MGVADKRSCLCCRQCVNMANAAKFLCVLCHAECCFGQYQGLRVQSLLLSLCAACLQRHNDPDSEYIPCTCGCSCIHPPRTATYVSSPHPQSSSAHVIASNQAALHSFLIPTIMQQLYGMTMLILRDWSVTFKIVMPALMSPPATMCNGALS